MKTKKVTLTGPEIAEAIGMWVQKKTPGGEFTPRGGIPFWPTASWKRSP